MSEVDPLSPSTRGHRRSLVGTSAALFAVTVFGVTIENIQGVGLSIELSQGLIGIVLMSCAAYFAIHFGFYFANDVSSGAYNRSLEPLKADLSKARDDLKRHREIVDGKNTKAYGFLARSVETILKSGIVIEEGTTPTKNMGAWLWFEVNYLVEIATRFSGLDYLDYKSTFFSRLRDFPIIQLLIVKSVEKRLRHVFWGNEAALSFELWLERNTYRQSAADISAKEYSEPIKGLPFKRKQESSENLSEIAKVIFNLANSAIYSVKCGDLEVRDLKRKFKRAKRYYSLYRKRMWGLDFLAPITIFVISFILALADPNISAGIHRIFYRVQDLIFTLLDSLAATSDAANGEPGVFCGWLGWTVAWSSMCEAP